MFNVITNLQDIMVIAQACIEQIKQLQSENERLTEELTNMTELYNNLSKVSLIVSTNKENACLKSENHLLKKKISYLERNKRGMQPKVIIEPEPDYIAPALVPEEDLAPEEEVAPEDELEVEANLPEPNAENKDEEIEEFEEFEEVEEADDEEVTDELEEAEVEEVEEIELNGKVFFMNAEYKLYDRIVVNDNDEDAEIGRYMGKYDPKSNRIINRPIHATH